MIRSISVALVVTFLGLTPAFAQTDEEVAVARQQYLDGDYTNALAVLVPAAQAGNPRAQNLVGAAYQYGNGGLAVDAQKALEYYNLSAAQNFPSAHHNLGVLYDIGMEGIPRDLTRARAYYEQSVTIGWLGSFSNLAVMLRDGIGGPADEPRAIALLEQGLAQGDGPSIHALAYMYYEGVAVPVDLKRARDLYEQAAAAGIPQAMNVYGAMLENAEGGFPDLPGAMAQYRNAMSYGEAYGGVNAAWLIFNHPEDYPDQVEGLALCYWARDHASAEDADTYANACDDVAVGYSKGEVASAIKRSVTF